jgi:V8-like Glu-specific endopeptidase
VSSAAPLTPEELVLRENVVAEAAVPSEVSEQFRRRELYFSAPSRPALDAKRLVQRVDSPGGDQVWVVNGSEQTIQGIRGQRARLASRPAKRRRSQAVATSRPAWVEQLYHPKLSVGRDFPVMNRASGIAVDVLAAGAALDARRVYYPGGYPWHCIGMVFTWDDASLTGYSARASGVLVGNSTVLTAGHMVPWESDNWKMLFVPGYYDGQSALGPGAASWITEAHCWNTNNVTSQDTAVLRLHTPLGTTLGHLGVKVYDSSLQDRGYWTLAGYATTVAGGARPSFQAGISITGQHTDGDSIELEHSGHAASGDSGGPLFGFWDDGAHIVGTTSGTESGGGTQIAAGGRALVDLVSWAESNWK